MDENVRHVTTTQVTFHFNSPSQFSILPLVKKWCCQQKQDTGTKKEKENFPRKIFTDSAFTCSLLTIETPEQCVKCQR